MSRKLSTRKRVFSFYCDAGHGWMKVSRKLIRDLDLEDKISKCSYQKGESAYLEEDLDAGLVLEALKERGIEFEIKHHHSGNRRSRIRGYACYKPQPKTGDYKVGEDLYTPSQEGGVRAFEIVQVTDTEVFYRFGQTAFPLSKKTLFCKSRNVYFHRTAWEARQHQKKVQQNASAQQAPLQRGAPTS